jgi:hypothetical protein
MNRNRTLLIVLALVAIGVAAWFYMRRGRENVAVDLIQQFATAKEKRPNPDAFSIIDATINGQTKKAIFTKDQVGTRIKWDVSVPENAWLNVSLGLKEEAWKMEGDGVLFRVLVTVGNTNDALASFQLNPFANPSDRQWSDLTLDLSQYAGQTIELIFLTNSSAPGADNRNGDLALWGDPRIIIR